jgi:hypothetical protein
MQHEWPPFVMTIKEAGRVLPHPSAIFHAKTTPGCPWVARTLSECTPVKRGKVSSNSATVGATKFVGFYTTRMRQYTTQFYSLGTDDRSSIDTGRATNLGLRI